MSLLLRTTILSFKVSYLTIVIVNDVAFVFSRRALLGYVDIYRASIRPIHSTTVVTLLSVVRLNVGYRFSLALTLSYVLAVLDIDSYSDIVV